MIEVLEFVFAGFWRWLGFAILLGVTTEGIWRVTSAVLVAWKGRD